MAFLNQLGYGQAVMAKSRSNGHHKAHMGLRQNMQRGLVALFFPAHRQCMFFTAFKKWRTSGAAYQTAGDILDLRHRNLLIFCTYNAS